MKIKIKKFRENTTIPKQASEFAGGWDVTASKIEQKEDDLVVCYLGFALDLPEGYKLTLVPRSSLTKTKWVLQNSPGLGDFDFKGEYQLRFRALPLGLKEIKGDGKYERFISIAYPEFPYKEGDRIGQVYLEEVIPIEFEEVDNLTNSERGAGGFGSTGK